ncbi:hypothetical protein KUCAC02_031660, partial [Chaenocephalus aceratus]
MNGPQQSDSKRQHLLERLLDAVKQCQIRFGGRKEIATDSDSRVICLCAQFEAVLQHGLRKSRGLALTAAALKQEHLNRHELQRFLSLRQISCELGRGRAWLRCALNEHSLERYLHTLLSERPRLGIYYEDWAFILDEERASMLPTMAAGLNSILFAINIDNTDLNGGVVRGGGSSVSDLLKESTQGIGSLWKESTQGVSSLLREISTPRAEGDPLPVLPRSSSADSGLRKERSVEEGVDPLEPEFSESPAHNGLSEPGIVSWVGLVVGSLSSVSTWSPVQVKKTQPISADILIPLNPAHSQTVSPAEDRAAFPAQSDSAGRGGNCESDTPLLTFNLESSPPAQSAPLSSTVPTSSLPESMTVVELRQAIVAMMNRKDELEEQNTSLRSLLDGEMEHSAGLRQETDLLKKKLSELEERHSAKVQALA